MHDQQYDDLFLNLEKTHKDDLNAYIQTPVDHCCRVYVIYLVVGLKV